MYETVNEVVIGLCSVFALSFSMMFHVMFKEAVTSSSLIGLVFVLANIPGDREPPPPPLLLPLAVATSAIWLSPMLFLSVAMPLALLGLPALKKPGRGV